MQREPIAITGMGIVSALGWSVAETWLAMEREVSGLGPLTVFDSPRWGHVPVGQVAGCPEGMPRCVGLGVHAASQALDDAGVSEMSAEQRRGAALVVGNCTGGMFESEAFLSDLLLDGQANFDVLANHTSGRTTAAIAQLIPADAGTTTANIDGMGSDQTAMGSKISYLKPRHQSVRNGFQLLISARLRNASFSAGTAEVGIVW